MLISGLTIARQTVTLGYPLEASLRSLLPLVDELVVNVGDSDDGTWEVVQSIGDPKIAAFRSTWDMTARNGLVLSEETNKALARCRGTWAVYLQADEVLHEDDLPALRAVMERHARSRTESFSFLYHHFYGSYDLLLDDPRHWYRRATRVVRTGAGVESVGDGCAFMVRDGDRWRRPRRKDLPARVYHYGWVRPPEVMIRKQRHFERLYYDADWLEAHGTPDTMKPDEVFRAQSHLRAFGGSHPRVMRQRIAARNWIFEPSIDRRWPDWLRRGRVHASWLLSKSAAMLLRR